MAGILTLLVASIGLILLDKIYENKINDEFSYLISN